MKKRNKKSLVLFLFLFTLTLGVVSFIFPNQSVNADTDVTVEPFGRDQSGTIGDDGGSSNKNQLWEYQYAAEPYAVFKNIITGETKALQITSYTQHTINVINQGWQQTFSRWATGQYLKFP